MAYVRMTETLVDETMRKISNMREAAKEPYYRKEIEYGTPLFKSMRATAEDAVWRDAPELRGKLPQEWLSKEASVAVDFFSGDGEERLLRERLGFPDDDLFQLPQPIDRYRTTEISVRIDDCPNDVWEWVENAVENAATCAEIDAKYQTVHAQVRAFLNAQPSLNRAVRDMPELELYIPESYLTKLRAPTPSRTANTTKPEAPKPEVDREQLAALGVAHRLSNSSR